MPILIICFISSAAFVNAQSSNNKKALDYYSRAQSYINKHKYPLAIQFLQASVKEDKHFQEAYMVLGDVFRLNEQYNKALANYNKVLELNPRFNAKVYYGLGVSYFHLSKYTRAKLFFDKYRQLSNAKSRPSALAKYARDCEFAIKAIKSPVDFKPLNLGAAINSDNDEYLPTLTIDNRVLVFTRRLGTGEDFYLSKNTDTSWTAAQNMGPSINSLAYNEGAECISADGSIIFFTSCNRPNGKGSCDIYVTRKNGNKWTSPKNLGSPVNTSAWESQPSLSPDGRTLYFASDRSGGMGNIDIWKTVWQNDGNWSIPKNLGPKINTAYEDISPFIHFDNSTLYFSSEGWPGMGGKDIFISRKDSAGCWQSPENIGYPLNTSLHESTLIVSANGRYGYFASNSLKGLGKYDLYRFEMPPAIRPQFVSFIKGQVFDSNSKLPLSARIQLINTANKQIVFESQSNAQTGGFISSLPAKNNYAFNVSKKGYLFYSGSFFLREKESTEPILLNIALQKIQNGANIILKNIFFETDSYRLQPESYAELDKIVEFMQQNPTVSIEISGHTDNVGAESYNQKLSENRAKIVYAYIVRKVPAPKRFIFKGYGETKPLTENTSDKGRSLNRRTEMKVITD